jgi:hypothetical protein
MRNYKSRANGRISIDYPRVSETLGTGWWMKQSSTNRSPGDDSLITGKKTGDFAVFGLLSSLFQPTAGRNGDAVSFDLTPIFNLKSQRRREPKVQPAQTVTLDAREGRNRALLMIVRAPCSIDNPPARFESWILLKSAPPRTK